MKNKDKKSPPWYFTKIFIPCALLNSVLLLLSVITDINVIILIVFECIAIIGMGFSIGMSIKEMRNRKD